jgi:membrane protein implicated in regulation of membrane protease activity
MTLSNFFLACLVFGFMLSALSFLAGSAHLHFHGHHASHGGGKLNFGSIAAFITWFGGMGYALTKFTGISLVLVILSAVLAGLAGAAIILWFIAKVLAPNDIPLDPADYSMIGALGTVSSPVVRDGTGEMIFVQQGRRAGVPIRSESGHAIATGKEVVVTRYEHGIAYVREWEELNAL